MYYGHNRKLNVIHCQLRLGCSDLNAHLFNHHVAESPNCVCCNVKEDCNHFFFKCFLYDHQRTVLFDKLDDIFPNIVFSSDLLLHGIENSTSEQNSGIAKAVENYILDSGRFRVY